MEFIGKLSYSYDMQWYDTEPGAWSIDPSLQFYKFMLSYVLFRGHNFLPM